jgi:hypothetical protein
VEKYRSGLGYKKISETLNIPQSTIKSMYKPTKRGLPTKCCGDVFPLSGKLVRIEGMMYLF